MSDIYDATKTAFMDGGSGGAPAYSAAEMPLNLIDDTIGIALSDDGAYTFNSQDGAYLGDIFDAGTTSSEYSGTGSYTTAESLSGFDIQEDATNTRAEWHASDYTFTGLDGGTIEYAVIAKQVGGDWTTYANDPLVAYITSTDFPLTTNGGDVTISWDAEGIIHIT